MTRYFRNLPLNRFGSVIVWIGLGLVTFTIIATIWIVNEDRQRAQESYKREIADLGRALSEQTLRYVQEGDLLLRDVKRKIARLAIRSPEQFHAQFGTFEKNQYLKDIVQNVSNISEIVVIDSAGNMVNSNRLIPTTKISASDLDYVRHFVDLDDGAVFIGAPTTSRVDGIASIFVALRLNAPDGSFLGVVAGLLDVDYLIDFYRALSTRPGRSVTLLRTDGLVLVRYPDPTKETGTWMPDKSPWFKLAATTGGSFVSPGYLGGIPALVSVNPLRTYPLVIDVSVKEYIEMALWRQQALVLGAAGTAMVAGFILLFWFIAVQFRIHENQNAALRKATDALRKTEHLAAEKSYMLETTLDNMDQGLLVVAADDTVAICNRRAMELLDLPAELMNRKPAWCDVLAYQRGSGEFAHTDVPLQRAIRRNALLDGPLIYDRERPNGAFLEVRTTPLPNGKAVRTYTDITDRKRAEQRFDFMAHHDGMTGLPNRVLLHDRLSQALAQAKRTAKSVAVLTLDLDHFKEINDTYGHDAGDRVLLQAADRLRSLVRAADTVARTGGDEFVVIQCGAPQPEAAIDLARRLVDALSQPFDVEGQRVAIGGTVGIALYPEAGATIGELLKNSDIALYLAKTDRRGTFCLFDSGADLEIRERHAAEQA
jgi:diguanylate cyclase (GGDEF)-like protein